MPHRALTATKTRLLPRHLHTRFRRSSWSHSSPFPFPTLKSETDLFGQDCIVATSRASRKASNRHQDADLGDLLLLSAARDPSIRRLAELRSPMGQTHPKLAHLGVNMLLETHHSGPAGCADTWLSAQKKGPVLILVLMSTNCELFVRSKA